MHKTFLFVFSFFYCTFMATAQNNPLEKKVHKIVFQLSSDDTLVHKGLIKQLNNVLKASPDAILEVVCHGPGIQFLLKDKTSVANNITKAKANGVSFLACGNTLIEKNINRDQIITEAEIVPSALIEIVEKQEAGWSYIKAGF